MATTTEEIIIKDPEAIKIIESNRLELICQISSDKPNFREELANALEHNTASYIFVVKNYAGPEDDIIYQIYSKKKDF